MNIFYYLNRGHEGLNKYASAYENDAEYLTGLFYGMLKEAARTNRKGGHGAKRTVDTHVSLNTPESKAKAAADSAASKAKHDAKMQRELVDSFNFPKNDVSPQHLKEQAKIKQTFRLADPEYAERLRNRGSRIGNALIGKYKTGMDHYRARMIELDDQLSREATKNLAGRAWLKKMHDAEVAELTGKHTSELSDLYSKINSQADELVGLRDALGSAQKQRALDTALIRSNKGSINNLKSVARSRGKAVNNLTKSLKRTRLGAIVAGLGGVGLGAGGLALYNRQQAQ